MQHAGRVIKEIAKLLLTIVAWPVRYTYNTATTLLSPSVPQATKPTKPSLIEYLEREIKTLQTQVSRYAEWHTRLIEETRTLSIEVLTAKMDARKAKKARELQDARVTHQQKTISTLQQQIASFPQEYLQLREKNAQLAKDVDALEQNLDQAREARNGAEEREVETAEEARAKVTKANNLQQLAEVEKDRAVFYFTKAERNFEERLKICASQIFNLKQEVAMKSRIDPRIFSQTVEQVHTLHRERDDARDALDLVNAQLEATKAAEAAAQSLVQTIRAQLQSVDGPDGIEANLYHAEVELAQCKTEARRKVKAAGSKCRHYMKKSEADRDELMKAQRSLEEKEGQHRMEIFELEMKHEGSMHTAQSKISNLEASTEALQASIHTLDADLERAEREAQLPRDAESRASLSRATAELQRVRNEHTSELQRVRDEHALELQAVRNKHATGLQRVRGDHATELQNREAETIKKCQGAYNERLAEWSEEGRKSAQQVAHWRSRAEAAEESVKALNQNAERVAREQGQRENELTARLQQLEAEAAQREGALEARLRQSQARVDELESDMVRARDDLGDLQASLNQGNQQIVAEGPAASAQVPQTSPAPQSNMDMPQEEMDEWLGGLQPVTMEAIRDFESFDQPQAANSAVPLQTSPTSPPSPVNSEVMSATIDDWLRRYSDLDATMDDPVQQPPAADSAAPLQTSPTSPPPEPALEFDEPELNLATELDLDSFPTSAPAQEPGPSAAPQHTLAPASAPHGEAIFTPPSLPMGMTPRGPRKAQSKPNHYTQQRRAEEAADDAELSSKLDYMFGNGPRPSAPTAPTQSVPLGIPGSSSFGKIASCIVLQALMCSSDFNIPVPMPSAEPQHEEEGEEEL